MLVEMAARCSWKMQDGGCCDNETRKIVKRRVTSRRKSRVSSKQTSTAAGDSFETVSFQKLASAYVKHIEGLRKARYHLPTLERHVPPYCADVRDLSQLRTPEILACFDHRRARTPSPTP